MALYPITPTPKIPYSTSDTFQTITSGPFESGASSRRPARLFPIFSAKLVYEIAPWTTFAPIYQFFNQQFGMYLPFTFMDFNGTGQGGIQWPALNAFTATANVTNQVFDLPMFSSSAGVLYDNGSPVTQDASNPPAAGKFFFLAGTGTDGRDQAKMNVQTGHVYTWQAFGFRAVNAIFDADVMSYSSLMAMLTSTGIGIIEAR